MVWSLELKLLKIQVSGHVHDGLSFQLFFNILLLHIFEIFTAIEPHQENHLAAGGVFTSCNFVVFVTT